MEMRARPVKVQDVLKVVRAHLDSGTYLDTRHAFERKHERGITRPEVIFVLKNGYHEKKKDQFEVRYKSWSYAIRGKTVDGRELRVIISFDEMGMLLITAIDLSL